MAGTVSELRVKLENLLHTAEPGNFDPIDWQRFYEIVVFAAKENLISEFSGADLRVFLERNNMREDLIRDLHFLYVHGTNIVRYSKAVHQASR